VRLALAGLQRSTQDLFGAKRQTLTVAGSASVIALWAVPRLAMLRQLSPATVISFATVHRDGDFSMAQADFEIRFGDGHWPGRMVKQLFAERLAPVVSPVLVHGSMEAWRKAPQIGVSGPRYGWLDWAAEAKVPPPPSPDLRFDSFVQARIAAIAGEGVLLGSLALLQADLAKKLLVRVPEPEVTMSASYWLTWAPSDDAFSDHSAVVDALTSLIAPHQTHRPASKNLQ
ncbi:MAG: LysR substrate-binding domain-containing protein, partial [Geminicoccaceae bacterium]